MLNTLDSENCASGMTGQPDVELSARYRHTVLQMPEDKAGPITDHSWRAPDLRCFTVMQIYSTPDGASVETEVTSINEGTPQEDLFEIPPDYTERSPLEEEHLHREMTQKPLWGEGGAAHVEKRYQRLRMRATQ
jgi:hypothetical protein